MGKAKTKLAPFDTTCTQNDKSEWVWTVAGLKWTYHPELLPINTVAEKEGPEPEFVGFFKTLNEAVCFSHGFDAGWNAGKRAMICPDIPQESQEHLAG